MASSVRTIRIGYVPEHYLLPLHLSLRHLPSTLKFELIPFPSGTGHMISSLRAPSSSSESIDLAIGLTEGWIAGLLPPNVPKEGDKGYNLVGQWVQNPLRWAIVTGKDRHNLTSVSSLSPKHLGAKLRVGVSRLGSGSHVMASVLAQREGWDPAQMEFVPVGPFKNLRDAVNDTTADFFMWEHFTTKPYFSPSPSTTSSNSVTLKHLGEIFTPWPSWSIVASTATFPSPSEDPTLSSIFSVLDQGIAEFGQAPEQEAVRILGTGEIGCVYGEEDAREWLKKVVFIKGRTRGVDGRMVDGVVKVLRGAGVVSGEERDVVGIGR